MEDVNEKLLTAPLCTAAEIDVSAIGAVVPIVKAAVVLK